MKLSTIAPIVGFSSPIAAAPPDPVDSKRWYPFSLVAELVGSSITTKRQPVMLYRKSSGKVILAVGNTKASATEWGGEHPSGARVLIRDSKEQQMILTPASSFQPEDPSFDVVMMDQAEATATELRNSKYFMFSGVLVIDTLQFQIHHPNCGNALPAWKQQARVELYVITDNSAFVRIVRPANGG